MPRRGNERLICSWWPLSLSDLVSRGRWRGPDDGRGMGHGGVTAPAPTPRLLDGRSLISGFVGDLAERSLIEARAGVRVAR